MVWYRVFIDGAKGATFFHCAEITDAMGVTRIVRWFSGVRAPTKSDHGDCEDDNNHEKSYIFSETRLLHRPSHTQITLQEFLQCQKD